MIAITNEDGQSLFLETGQQATLEQAVGWLSDDQLPGAKSYPIAFPIAPNEMFLRSGYRPDASRPNMEIVVQVRLTGVMFRRCKLNYRVAEGKGSGYLKFDGGDVFSQLQKLTLQDAIPDALDLQSSLLVPLVTRLNEVARLGPGQSPFTFFPIRNEAFFEDSLDAGVVPGYEKQPYVNAWKAGSFVVDTVLKKGYPVCPQFFLWWVLERIFLKAGYCIEGDWIGQKEIQRLVILNLTAIETSAAGLISQNTITISAARHLPKMSVGDFLKAIRQGFGLIFSFDSTRQVVTIRQMNDVVRSAAIDLTPYIAGAYGIDAAVNAGFTVFDGIDAADDLYRDAQRQAIEPTTISFGPAGTGRTEVKLSIAGTQQINEPAPGGGSWAVPALRQPGNTLDPVYSESDRFPAKPLGQQARQLRNDVALRIIAYQGMVPTSTGALYPAASNVGTKLTGRYGRYRRLLRSLLFFRDQARAVAVPLDLPVGVLTRLKLHQPIALKLDSHVRRTYLIDKLQAESPGPSGIMRCKLTCLTIPDGIDLPADAPEPAVWVAMDIVRSYVETPGEPSFPTRRITNKLTITVWANADRTIPALTPDISLVLRIRQSYITGFPGIYLAPQSYYDNRLSYQLTQHITVIETAIDSHRQAYSATERGRITDWFKGEILLDPGEDDNYVILPTTTSGVNPVNYAFWP